MKILYVTDIHGIEWKHNEIFPRHQYHCDRRNKNLIIEYGQLTSMIPTLGTYDMRRIDLSFEYAPKTYPMQ